MVCVVAIPAVTEALTTMKPLSPAVNVADAPVNSQTEVVPEEMIPVKAGAKVHVAPGTGWASPPYVYLYSCATTVVVVPTKLKESIVVSCPYILVNVTAAGRTCMTPA